MCVRLRPGIGTYYRRHDGSRRKREKALLYKAFTIWMSIRKGGTGVEDKRRTCTCTASMNPSISRPRDQDPMVIHMLYYYYLSRDPSGPNGAKLHSSTPNKYSCHHLEYSFHLSTRRETIEVLAPPSSHGLAD